MGSNVKNIDGYRARGGETPWVDPHRIMITGIDVPATAENWFAYCPRLDEDVDDDFVLSVREDGVRKPVEVYRDGNRVVLLAGRRRVRAARIIWKEQADRGVTLDKRIAVRVLIRSGAPDELFKYNVRDNSDRKDLNPIQRATLMQSYQKYAGDDVDKTARMFGVSGPTVRSHLALLDLAAAVQQAVARREFSVSNALRLSSLPRAEQADKLAEYRAQSSNGTEPVEDRTRPPRRTVAGGRGWRPKTEIKKVREYLDTEDDLVAKVFAAALAWVANDDVKVAACRKLVARFSKAQDEAQEN
jgi:ParB/RepB/Spo0J family partition protein